MENLTMDTVGSEYKIPQCDLLIDVYVGLELFVLMENKRTDGTFEGINAKNQEVIIRDETGTLRNIPVAKARIFRPGPILIPIDAGGGHSLLFIPELHTIFRSTNSHERCDSYPFSGKALARLWPPTSVK
ncbi:hypothetical protein ACKJSM_03420 [Pseudomonas sp. PHC1]|uniref:hypothetical protein n=1 Tax=Pseudomonas sp. PHC1 TaxID=3384759 RepID=UPI00396F67D4